MLNNVKCLLNQGLFRQNPRLLSSDRGCLFPPALAKRSLHTPVLHHQHQHHLPACSEHMHKDCACVFHGKTAGELHEWLVGVECQQLEGSLLKSGVPGVQGGRQGSATILARICASPALALSLLATSGLQSVFSWLICSRNLMAWIHAVTGKTPPRLWGSSWKRYVHCPPPHPHFGRTSLLESPC